MNKPFNKKLIFLAVLLLGIAFIRAPAYNWYIDNWKDHRKILKAIGTPVQETVSIFYKNHQRFPTMKEIEDILEVSGCSIKVKEQGENRDEIGDVYESWVVDECDYSLTGFRFGAKAGYPSSRSTRYTYEFSLAKGQSRCFFNFSSKGFYDGIACYQGNAFFTLDH